MLHKWVFPFIAENIIIYKDWFKKPYENATTRALTLSSVMLTCVVQGKSGAGTSSYRVMSNTAIWIFSTFRDRTMAELMNIPISVIMFSLMFHPLMWINYFCCSVAIRLCHGFHLSWHVDIRFFELLTLDNCRYQTCLQNIKTLYC